MTNIKRPQLGSDESLVMRILEGNPAFHVCQPETQDLLLQAATTRRYQKGEGVHEHGQLLTALYVVISGSLEFGMLSASGRRYVRWHMAPGQMHGIIPVLDGKGAIYDVRAHEDSVLLLIPQENVMLAIARDPGLAQAILLDLCARSRNMHDSAIANALLSLRCRVARMLLLLMDSHGRNQQDGILISLKLSQDQFAEMLAVTRQHLNKELKQLESEGLIEIAYSQITIIDLDGLNRAAEEDIER